MLHLCSSRAREGRQAQGRRLRAVRRLLPAATGRRPAPADACPARRAFRLGPRQRQVNALPRAGAPRHPGAPVSRLPPGEHERVLTASPSRAPSRSQCRPPGGQPHRSQAAAARPGPRRPAQDRWPHRSSLAHSRAAMPPQVAVSAAAAASHPGDGSRPGRPPLASRLGPPARLPPGLPQARHLAVRAGNTAVQRQGLPGHPGRRTPGPPPPAPLHHRAADLLQDPGHSSPGRPRLEAQDAGPHRDQPPASDRIERAGTVPGCSLP